MPLLALILSACHPAAQAPDRPAASAAATAADGLHSPLPVSVAPLTRAEIIAAAERAADAVASGMTLPASNKDLTARSFELALPIGCSGEAGEAWSGWTRDGSGQVLRLTARPEQWGQQAWVRALAGTTPFDAVEGFWIERPWTSAETCPAAATNLPPAPGPATGVRPAGPTAGTGSAMVPNAAAPSPTRQTLARQTLGLAEFFTPGAPRTAQRGGRPYAFTLKQLAADTAVEPRFALRLTGRVRGYTDGQPIHCAADNSALPPRCLVAVEFTRIAFVDLRSGQTVADWKR